MRTTHTFLALTLVAEAACRSPSTSPPAAKDASTLGIASDVFKEGETIPLDSVYSKNGCNGKNLSPDLRIDPTSIPTGTKSFALLLHDPDAPMSGGFYHWVMFDIPANARSIEATRPAADILANGAYQGTNDFDDHGYSGPCPPAGKPHHYKLSVYALDVPKLGLDPSARGSDVARAMSPEKGPSHILAVGTITALYAR